MYGFHGLGSTRRVTLNGVLGVAQFGGHVSNAKCLDSESRISVFST